MKDNLLETFIIPPFKNKLGQAFGAPEGRDQNACKSNVSWLL